MDDWVDVGSTWVMVNQREEDTMRTTTEEAKVIRQTLRREHGITSKQVSVRTSYFSMGSSITVEIMDPAVPMAIVEPIARRAEQVRRDEMTGEILSGGNTYLHLGYSHEASVARGAPFVPAVEKAVAELDSLSEESARSAIVPIEGTGVGIAYVNGLRDLGFRLWPKDGASTQVEGIEDAARRVADLAEPVATDDEIVQAQAEGKAVEALTIAEDALRVAAKALGDAGVEGGQSTAAHFANKVCRMRDLVVEG